ncbi:MAG: choice-of-anchor J domain-containing protein, partial [Pyrinomonadaceae bacterium]|nr:choice-of-anchor J domain-containing protein [Phycisphaerales bacterium]
MLNARILMCAAGYVAAATLACPALGQANFTESFEGVGDGNAGQGGPPTLVNRGWIFRNQSNPVGDSPYWTEFGGGWGHIGNALGHGAFSRWQNSSSRLSAWIILPAIPNQIAGDPLRLWTAAPTNAFGTNNSTLEVRYSPTGNIGTGSGPTGTGSFTEVLATIPGTNGHDWTERIYSLPGTGRVAMRMTLGPHPASYPFTGTFLIDTLRVGNPPASPYPLPQAGQTVHWTSAHSPVMLARDGTGQSPRIPAGATVIVDPGVEIRVGDNVVFDIAGTLALQGNAAQPVRLRGNTGGGAGWARISVASGGLLTGSFADVETYTDLIYGGKASFTDSAFRDPSNPTGLSYDSAGDIGHRFFDGNLAYARQVLSLTGCTFEQGCNVALLRGWLAARDCTFTRGGAVTVDGGPIGGEAMFVVGSSILDNVTVNEAYIDLTHDHSQHRYVGNVQQNGNPQGAGIRLAGGASYLIDSNVALSGNRWPVEFGSRSAGILPGSVLPASGNELNEIPTGLDDAPFDERVVWADAGVPYIVTQNGALRGQITILPGVTVKLLPDAVFFFDTDSNGLSMPVFLGEPERPIRFMPYVEDTRWYSLVIGNTATFGTRWDWCVFEGGRFGVGSSEMPLALDNCVFRDNIRALYTETMATLRKCTFENNVFSYSGERFAPLHDVKGFLDANHPSNPNTFINNNGNPLPDFFGSFLPSGGLIASARHNSLEDTDSDVRNNWWGTPTGPREARNPGGTGDAVYFGRDAGGFLLPFLKEPPTTNPPPVVRFITEPDTVVPGEKVHVQWTARDDGSITTQRVYHSMDSNVDSQMQLLAEIPAGARSFEWIVPTIGTPGNGADQFFRVIATDDLGQEGIADIPLKITNPADFTGTMTQSPGFPGLVRPGNSQAVCAAVSGQVGSMYASIELDNDDSGESLGGVFASGGQACTVLPAQIPDISTDRARIRFDATASLNQVRSYYGPYFSIRPDPILGNAAPIVNLTSSHDGQTYPGGSTIALSWTASDDEALRSFDIRASYDGGARWFRVAKDLPAEAREFTWQLPASTGVPSAKVRVVAKDIRFQNTSAESAAFSIAAGDW